MRLHALAIDPVACERALRGVLFPDQVVFLGPRLALLGDDTVDSPCRLVPGQGVLVDRALTGGAPFTYREAEDALRAAAQEEDLHIGEFDQHSLWGALDAIAEQCRRRREPPLDVLVVSKDTGRPGRGYWQKHAFLPGDGDELEKQVFERHFAAVRASDWSRDV